MGLVHRRPIGDSGSEGAYRRYAAFCGTSTPSRTLVEVQTVMDAAGMRYEEASDPFWRSLRADWVSGAQDVEPFTDDPAANEEYAIQGTMLGLLPLCLSCFVPLWDPEAVFCTAACRARWAQRNRAAITAGLLGMPDAEFDTFISIAGGASVEAADESRLAAWLDA